jgi:meiotically up-regulated gene 157 (Mug157) protein
MVWSGFRPSDDACVYGYHVPSNALTVVALQQLATLLETAGVDEPLTREARHISAEIDEGIRRHAVVPHPAAGHIYAYEVDGLGNHLLLDDANPPNLISLPYLDYCPQTDPVYVATRSWALSPANPCWAGGAVVHGLGSRHTRRGFVWPLGIAVEGITAASADEREDALLRLEATLDREGLFHESVDPDDPGRYTRHWFSWADMLYVELVFTSAGLIPSDSESVR